ncbi:MULTISPECIES: DUF305 domain-containing protein [Bartonella]|uniref:DUF305 domain-containing protein n=1 Tax=Bartonella choladocola TaxID=2750995 RepID=A0A1U9ME85_9HYPH|nr:MULTISPECIES: DUF305 domain-containing protein [Bartonella]AQT46166.1 protein of unknown function (DUF305) [Bartonella choladocola]MBH9974823.1 DUF305 domain-containing protein [Bartonella choladocola]MBI0014429.1 DUF305 domain-containing protein [Bartonella sp. B10834G3]
MKKIIAALCISCASIGYSAAQNVNQNIVDKAQGAASAVSQTLSASSTALDKVNESMMKNMSVKMSGNADVDFIKMMLAHHKGAVDMAEVELQYGKDPEARKLAETIISAQQKEITEMQDWLKKHDSQ